MTSSLPRWDLTSIFPGLDSDGIKSAVITIEAGMLSLTASLDNEPLTVDDIAQILESYNVTLELMEIVEGFVACMTLEDSSNERACNWATRTRRLHGELHSIERRLADRALLLDIAEESEWPETLRQHRFWLEQARIASRYAMSSAEEDLAVKLNESGGLAWEILRHQTVGGMTVAVSESEPEVPLVTLQQRNSDPDRAVREEAYRLEMAAWEPVAPTVAAALNGIKGEVLTMSHRRGWAAPLDSSLHENRIDRDVLNAMLSAAETVLLDIRRYLVTKARRLNLNRVAWFDLYAPVSSETAAWPFETACELVIEQFGHYSNAARSLVETALTERWIDAEPRRNKRGGGMSLTVGEGTSRILINYTPSFDRLRMLAHELGHAYHASALDRAGRTAIQRWMTPWVLSESVAIFFETLVRNAAVRASEPSIRLAAAESNLQTLCRRVADVLCAFRFEERFFARRMEGAAAVDDITALMSEIQQEVYGDGLDPAALHPYMWAVLPHYYTTESSFNNYPYMFGTLFSLGLYARFQAGPAEFSVEFDDFLSRTGMDDAATLTGRFDIDLRSPDFWLSGIDLIRQEIDRFERCIPGPSTSIQ